MFSLLRGFIKSSIPVFLLPAIVSVVFVPLIRKAGLALDVYAHENARTVHHGKIVRIGGIAIFIAFSVGMAIYFNADKTINGILLGGMVVFLAGVIDDIIDMKPKVKLLFQCAGALIAMLMGGVHLDVIYLPGDISIKVGAISYIVTFFWIVGVTNAINLIDGLDGLSSGISMIVLVTISLIAYQMVRMDVWKMAILLTGSIFGFWWYNFYPAKIFMGDCGALYLGYMIACISLLGFKTATFISLGFPIIVLFVPISDTLLAIIRRKLKGERIDVADKEHMHHILMYKLNLGHRNTVLTLYAVTLAFALCSLVTFYNEKTGMLILLVLLFVFDLFIESTGMLNKNYHPILTLVKKVTGKDFVKK